MMVSDRWGTIAEFLKYWLSESQLPPDLQTILDRYYKNYRKQFGPYVQRHYTAQTKDVLTLVESGARSILEVGSGCGTEALWLALNGAVVISIDINEERLKVARARQGLVERQIRQGLDLQFRYKSIFELTESACFDVVWMEQTFHHLEPRAEVYQIISRILKPGGYVVISDANAWNPLLQLKLLLQRGFQTKIMKKLSNGRIEEYGNERITVPGMLKREFRSVGIRTESVRYFRMFPNEPWTERFGKLEKVIAPISPRFFFTHYNFVGRKTNDHGHA